MLFIICKPVMSTLDNRNEIISGCRHSKKFLLNTVLTWLVLVANLTCCKHHLSTTRHAPTPRLTFIVLFYLMIRLAGGMTLCRVAINVQDIIQSHQSTSIIYIHIIIQLYQEAKINAAPTPINNRTVHAQEHVLLSRNERGFGASKLVPLSQCNR